MCMWSSGPLVDPIHYRAYQGPLGSMLALSLGSFGYRIAVPWSSEFPGVGCGAPMRPAQVLQSIDFWPRVGTIYILGALGYVLGQASTHIPSNTMSSLQIL